MEESDLERNGNGACQNLSSRLHGSMKQSGFNWTNTTKIEGNKTKAIFFRDKTSLTEKLNLRSKLKTYILLDGKIELQFKIGNLHIAPYHRSLAPGSPSPPELGFEWTSLFSNASQIDFKTWQWVSFTSWTWFWMDMFVFKRIPDQF